MGALNKTINLKGTSGESYKFNLYTINTKFNPVKAIYLVSKRTNEGNHRYIYIGQTEDLSTRFDNHHKQNCFERNGYNCIGILQVKLQNDRDYIEKDLIKNNNPLPCNEIFNS